MNKEKFLQILLSASILIFIFSTFDFSKKNQAVNSKNASFACEPSDFSGIINYSEMLGIFEGEKINLPKLAYDLSYPDVMGVSVEERWIEVDLSEQKLYAWEGDRIFLETPISTGLSYYPTPKGEFRIWSKLRATKMEGGSGSYYYYLPNVPYVMFFENDEVPGFRGYGLHGTYWHDDFGTPRSHGCVNLPTNVAKELYFWTNPKVPEGKWMESSSTEKPGTRIVVHD